MEQEEAKRQVLRKRAERTAVEEETNINWDDEDEEQSGEPSISEELQVVSSQVDYSGFRVGEYWTLKRLITLHCLMSYSSNIF